MVDIHYKVSIIIPTYNMGSKLSKAIESALSQTFSDLEVIVINDGSTDNTEEVLKRFLRQHQNIIYYNQENRGKPSAVNSAIEKSSGEFIAILDADDELPEDSVELRINFLEQNQGIDAVFGDTNYLDSGKVYHIRCPKVSKTNEELTTAFLLAPKVPFHAMSVMYRREVFEKIGLFDIELRRAEDIDFAVRLLIGCNVGYINKPVYNYHVDTHGVVKRLKHRFEVISGKSKIIGKHKHGIGKMGYRLANILFQGIKLPYECFTYRK